MHAASPSPSSVAKKALTNVVIPPLCPSLFPPQDSVKAARALAGRREGAADVWERAVLNLLAYGAPGRMDKANVVRTTEVYTRVIRMSARHRSIYWLTHFLF